MAVTQYKLAAVCRFLNAISRKDAMMSSLLSPLWCVVIEVRRFQMLSHLMEDCEAVSISEIQVPGSLLGTWPAAFVVFPSI